MLGYLAIPYKDELLLSSMARSARHNGMLPSQLASALGLSQRAVCGSFGLPNNLDSVAEALGPFIDCTGEELIRRYTLLPYFSSYLPIDKRLALEREMRAAGANVVGVHAGIIMSSSARLEYRRICPECVSDELGRLGETYWHRAHQLPGVFVCHIHAEPLRRSRFRYATNTCASQIALPHDEVGCPLNIPAPIPVAHQVSIASASLLTGIANVESQVQCQMRYREAVIRGGFFQHDARLNSRQLKKKLEEYFSERHLAAIGCAVNKTQSWATSIVTPSYRWRFSPIKHVLMNIFTTQLRPLNPLPNGSVLALAVLKGEAIVPSAPLSHSHGTGGRKHHNWTAKDEEFLERLKTLVRELEIGGGKQVKFSRTMLAREVGCLGLIRGRPEAMPRCIEFLDRVVYGALAGNRLVVVANAADGATPSKGLTGMRGR